MCYGLLLLVVSRSGFRARHPGRVCGLPPPPGSKLQSAASPATVTTTSTHPNRSKTVGPPTGMRRVRPRAVISARAGEERKAGRTIWLIGLPPTGITPETWRDACFLAVLRRIPAHARAGARPQPPASHQRGRSALSLACSLGQLVDGLGQLSRAGVVQTPVFIGLTAPRPACAAGLASSKRRVAAFGCDI
jgi:hypothetical protein